MIVGVFRGTRRFGQITACQDVPNFSKTKQKFLD
jgi:hypothetical protein